MQPGRMQAAEQQRRDRGEWLSGMERMDREFRQLEEIAQGLQVKKLESTVHSLMPL